MKQQHKNIEIEFRARFGKGKYKSLKRFLNTHARKLGRDGKDVFFFMFPNKLLKVVNNVSRKTAKISLKLNKIGKGSDFEEIEVPINQRDFEKTAQMFLTMFGVKNSMRSFQRRHNYLYKGVEIALKWSAVWGYHMELEVVVNDKERQSLAERKIREVANKLGVKIMTDGELKKFTREAEKKYKISKKQKS